MFVTKSVIPWYAHPDSQMLFSPDSFRLLSQQGQGRLQPNTLLQFFQFMLCCPLLAVDCPGPPQQHFLNIFWADTSHVNPDFAFKNQWCAAAATLHPNHGSQTKLLPQVLSPASTIEPLEFASSTSPSRLLLPSTWWPK